MTQSVGIYQPRPLKHGDRDTCTCPNCWVVFPFEDALYVARDPKLIGDPCLGPDAPARFKPSRFTAEGHALDAGGHRCLDMACPSCHLEVPKSISEFASSFFSIIGTPSSGKSVFLGTVAWELRRVLAEHFGLAFTDLEANLNEIVRSYEDTLFFAKDPNLPVAIRKTEQQGELYNRVMLSGVETLLPKPFLFSIRPQPHHPDNAESEKLSRTLVLYDNAGEHFSPSQDTATQPGTMHMARSECLMMVFDPTQDPRFRKLLSNVEDPQLKTDYRVNRQDVVFNEAARRIRRHLGLPQGQLYPKWVIVVVNKSDTWRHLLKVKMREEPVLKDPRLPINVLDIAHIEDISCSVRHLLAQVCPEVGGAVEGFGARVVYIPVSSFGGSPKRNASTNALEIRPADIKPHWVTVPFLYALSKLGLIYRGRVGSSAFAGLPSCEVLRQAHGTVQVRFPDGLQLTLPDRIMGQAIHQPLTGERFVIPTPVVATAPGARPPPAN